MTTKLGSTFKQAKLSGGLWVCTFHAADLNITLPDYECYRIVISNGPPGSMFNIYLNNQLWDAVFPGDNNSWDPNNPLPLEAGDALTFNWNLGGGTAPFVWLYFQQTRIL